MPRSPAINMGTTFHIEVPGGLEKAKQLALRRLTEAVGNARVRGEAVPRQSEINSRKYSAARNYHPGGGINRWLLLESQARGLSIGETVQVLKDEEEAEDQRLAAAEQILMESVKLIGEAQTSRAALEVADSASISLQGI
jgi:hypothetical protein